MTICAAVVLLAIGAGSAQAKQGPGGEGPARTIERGSVRDDPIPAPGLVVLRGTHGWRITIGSEAATRSRPGGVSVDISGADADVRYAAPARTVGEGIHANLGVLGRIDLRWVPDGRVAEVSFSCHGHGPKLHIFFRAGVYIGTLRIRGGNGFTEVRRQRIRWRRSWYRRASTCRLEGGELVPGPGEILNASATRPGSHTVQALRVHQPKPGATVDYSAVENEQRGSIGIERSTWAFGRSRTLTLAPDFSTATVELPGPFSGSASFVRTKGEHGTWLGDLAVAFPDGSEAPLAGDSFDARFHSGLLEGILR